MTLASVIDQLRLDPAFAEDGGSEASVSLPGLPHRHFVAPDPGAAWALNLALLTAASPLGRPPVAGLVSRALFRSDLEPEEIATALLQGVSSALAASFQRLEQIHVDLDRGGRALAHRSRNSKAREAWLIVLSLNAVSRAQLARGLGLSRAGADIQALALADAGLATLATGGKIAWSRGEAVRDTAHASLDRGPLGDAVSDLDASLAEIDRLLARTTR
ncbi:hypothetical protein PX554_22815 [Sphingomonas sp. H39-1-10]|uniref:hypothetical protein n=1 Tax=Sphingomonas pollutisoli TaxID=3030829 RepID=UPI0023BA3449|nr:hypothetical protein [Sphingomonas pollutisoli]MDF0490960.1 hypothetical protein [Sphingomonas pollutisoli]